MSWFSKYFYSQALFPYASKAMEFVAGSAVYAGSYIFSYLELMYIRDFDTKHRQIKATDVRTDEKSTVSEKWENPEIVGENRRSAHTVLHSFRSADKALKYWSDEQVDEQVYCNKMLLTGYPGLPNPDKLWQFLLVGSPVDAPHGWELRGFDTSTGHWSDVSLPAHWQCQGFDIPIYTNTVYPVC